jgi:hypothetical protein
MGLKNKLKIVRVFPDEGRNYTDELNQGLGRQIKFFTFRKLSNQGSKLLLPMHKSEKLERGGTLLNVETAW